MAAMSSYSGLRMGARWFPMDAFNIRIPTDKQRLTNPSHAIAHGINITSDRFSLYNQRLLTGGTPVKTLTPPRNGYIDSWSCYVIGK